MLLYLMLLLLSTCTLQAFVMLTFDHYVILVLNLELLVFYRLNINDHWNKYSSLNIFIEHFKIMFKLNKVYKFTYRTS